MTAWSRPGSSTRQTREALKVEKHPGKTFRGRTCRGFDFLAHRFMPTGLGVTAKTVARFAVRRTRLYEQGALAERIRSYVRHWREWMTAGMGRHRLTLSFAASATLPLTVEQRSLVEVYVDIDESVVRIRRAQEGNRVSRGTRGRRGDQKHIVSTAAHDVAYPRGACSPLDILLR
jgi:hypothetical protein